MFIKKRFLIYLVLFMFVVSVVYASDWVYSPGEINVNIFENYSNWNRSDSNLYPFHSTDNLKIPTLSNCDTIDTDANGVMSCGSDATAAGADPTLWKKLNATNFINIYLPHFWNKDNNDTSAILTQLSSNITRGDLITPDNGTWASNYGNVTDNDQIANSAGYTTNTGDITAITEDGTTPLTFSGCDTGSCAIGMDDVLTQAEFDVVVINRTLDEISKFINTSGFNYSIDLSSYISDASSYQLISNAWNKANNDTSNYLIQLGLNITRGDLITPDNTTWAGEYGNVTLVSQLDNDANYLTSYTETDPIMSALNGSILFTWNMSHIGNVTDNDQIANSAGYITSYTDTLSSTAQHVTNITDYTGGRNITLITGDENITATLSGNTYTLHFVTSILLTYLKTIFERTSTSWNLANNDTSATLTQLSSNVTRGDLITPDNGTWASKYGNVTLVSQLACSNCIQLAELDVGDVSDDIAGDIASGELNDNIILDDDLDLTDITLADFTNDRTDLYNDNNATYSFGNRTGDNISFVGGRLWLNLSCEQLTGTTDCSKINESVDLSSYISDASSYQLIANAWTLDDNDTSNYLTQLGLNITRGDLITPDNGTWAGKYGNVTDNDQIANSAGYTTNTGDITAITEDGTTPLTFSGCDTGSCVIGMDDVLTQAEFDVVVINRTEDEIGNLANSSLLNHIINSISVLVINRTLDEIADEANSSLINYIINSIDVLVINRTDDEIGDLANSSLLNHIQNNNDTVTSLLDRKNESLLALSQFDNDEGFITIDTRAKTDNDILYNDSDTHYFNKTSFGEEFNQTFTGDENITITKSGNNFAFHFVTNILLTFLKTVFYDSEGDLTGLLDDDYVDVDEAPSAADIEGNFGAGLTIVAGAVDDAEMDYGQVTLVDFTNDPKFVSNNTPVVFTNITITETNNTIGNFSIIQFNSSCTGFRMGATGGGLFSCT